MTYNYATPEEVGIPSENIEKFINILEENSLATHNLIIMRQGKVVFEHYWEPFHREFRHRMYSVTKSFVSLAIGFLEQEGRINLDDPISKYFPKESVNSHPYQKSQTIRHMLMMATAMPNTDWFRDKPKDRVQHYFDRNGKGAHPSGTVYCYDSEGSFILGTLVERVTGQKLFVFLKEKLFDKIGLGEVDCLECTGGHSWSDSALLCRPIDLLRVVEFCLNKGEGILNEDYIIAATKKQIDNSRADSSEYANFGYGYQIWRNHDNSFFFNGMGCQYALCVPEKELIMIYNGDNQGNANAERIIFDNFFQLISREAGQPLPPSKPICTDNLKLHFVKGKRHSIIEKSIGGKVYKLEENPMGITEISFTFEEEKGILYYKNAQGEKEIAFGLCKNEFGFFPQSGYSDRVGTLAGNIFYKCAASAAWVDDSSLFIKVQIIDNYFGNLGIRVRFSENNIGLQMFKAAEDFLNEYEGFAGGSFKK